MISPMCFGFLAAIENRLFDFDMPKIFGMPLSTLLPLVLAVVGFALGVFFAHSIRMREYGWKVGLILSSILVSLSVVLLGDYKLGVDLQGGVILVYQVDKKETAALDPQGRDDQWSMSGLLEVMKRRLNPDGLKEIVIRPFGGDQIEIVVPEADPAEVDLIKRKITTGGSLRFLIVANDPVKDARLIELAKEQAETKGAELDRNVKDGEEVIGFWAGVARESAEDPTSPFRFESIMYNTVLRDSRTGKILELAPQVLNQIPVSGFSDYLAERGIKQIDVLMNYDSAFDIRGSDLSAPAKGLEVTGPIILFGTRGEGVAKMSGLTSENLGRNLGIVFDNELLSAPTIQSRISDSGRITGKFTEKEVDFMVEILRSGSMPVVLYDNPISENRIGSILGRDTIVKGFYSLAISLGLVLVFVGVYYRFAGLVACVALVLNLLLTVAIMIILRAPFTLPGLAGLVLTVGMSIDANVLIFERIREEKEKGAALRSAIRNGFDRAMVTVIDSNLTTLLTAVVLYLIGTDQVRGFGITLILGILTSMFTAIFMSRAILEIGERQRWIKDLKMFKMFETLHVDWTKLFVPATVASLVLIAAGLVATVARGKGLFDTDLVGGTSVSFILREPIEEAEMRSKLGTAFEGLVDDETQGRVDFSVNEMTIEGEEHNTGWKVDSSLQDVARLQEIITKTFRTENDKSGLKTYEMNVANVQEASAPANSAKTDDADRPANTKALPPTAPSTQRRSKPGDKIATPPPADTKADTDTDTTTPATEEPVPPAPGDAAPPATDEPVDASEKATPPAAETPAETPAEESADKSTDASTDEPEAKPAAEEPNASRIRVGSVYLTSFLVQDEEPAIGDQPATDKADANTDSKSDADVDAPDSDAKTADEPAPEAPSAPAAPAAKSTQPPASPPVGAVDSPAVDPAADEATDAGPVAPTASTVWTTAKLTFGNTEISGQALKDRIGAIAKKELGEIPYMEVDHPDWDRRDNSAFSAWTVSLQLPEEQAAQVFAGLQAEFDSSPIWQTSSKIGGQVSSDTRYKAVTAILFSLAGIMAYVWFRFHQLSWGIAAIAAVVHDALIMLGAIAASYWLAGALGFAGVEEFKISLPVIAAFLTLIGYSINDTIVIFDRIREIRGKSPNITAEMINGAVNQTMSRTILTGGLTFITVLILYLFGGPGIHAFAFSLVIGMLAGVYSTVFIASPLLLYLLGGKPAAANNKSAPRQVVRSSN